MPPPISVFQEINLSSWIENIKDLEKKNIAERIYKGYWSLLTVSSGDVLLGGFLIPAIITTPVPFLFYLLFPNLSTQGYSVFSWLIGYVILQVFSIKYRWFESKRLIDNMPEVKKCFELYISDPKVKEVYEEMKTVFNGRV